MDSGNEVIIIEEKLATTNGINGNGTYEEVVVVTAAAAAGDMKTRSKGTDGGVPLEDGAAKPKLRSTRTASTNVHKPDDKAGSDTEKKDRKANLRSGTEADTTSKASAAGGDAKASGTVASKKAALPAVTEGTPSKKKGGDDDSGINSRSSSVSNEDTYSSRMRTRSKTALSSSTPASTKKGASRMPLSTYDFEDISFDEDPSTSNALKRKATMYVEEMEEENETEPPAAKRPVVAFGGTVLLNALLYPFRAIRGRISIASQTEQKQVAKDDAASQTHVTKVIDDDPEKEHVASQTEIDAIAATQTADNQKTPGTCVVM